MIMRARSFTAVVLAVGLSAGVDAEQSAGGLPEFVGIPASSFTMGCVAGDEKCYDDERPAHPVTVQAFRMAKYEVTVGDYRRFADATGYRTDAERGASDPPGCFAENAPGISNHDWKVRADRSWHNPGFPQADDEPVVCVSWNDANAYAIWMAKVSGRRIRGSGPAAAPRRIGHPHDESDPAAAVRGCEAIVVGGGNTFHLLTQVYRHGLKDVLTESVRAGVPFLGWSAGSNLACPGIWTTNDMPVIEPPSLSALGLLPFQVNPHFTDAQPAGHQGETRSERIAEFLALNPGTPVVDLREGALLRVEGGKTRLFGVGARVFRAGAVPWEAADGAELAFSG